MADTNDPRLQKGYRFQTVVDGTTVIVEVDEVIMTDGQEAMLRTHIVGRPQQVNGE